MTTARELMHVGAECIGEGDNLMDAARMMRDLDVGSLPICGRDDKLHGIVTDRDIVVKCLAEGRDPSSVTAGDLAQGTVVYCDAGADESEVMRLMEQHHIRRLPVIENHRLVGMISEIDIARIMPEEKIADWVEKVYSAR